MQNRNNATNINTKTETQNVGRQFLKKFIVIKKNQ